MYVSDVLTCFVILAYRLVTTPLMRRHGRLEPYEQFLQTCGGDCALGTPVTKPAERNRRREAELDKLLVAGMPLQVERRFGQEIIFEKPPTPANSFRRESQQGPDGLDLRLDSVRPLTRTRISSSDNIEYLATVG